jgi:hypothetical protein
VTRFVDVPALARVAITSVGFAMLVITGFSLTLVGADRASAGTGSRVARVCGWCLAAAGMLVCLAAAGAGLYAIVHK